MTTTDPLLRLRLIDGFELHDGMQPLQLARGCQRLVAFLALWERPVLRSFVSGYLWPDSDTEHANASLRSTLWRLPGGKDQRLVTVTASHLVLEESVEVDYRDALGWARAMLAGGIDALPAPWTLGQINGLSGEVLPDWYDEWVGLARERFRQLRLHALELLCQQLAAHGRYGEALLAGLGAVAIEPLRESAHRCVIAVHLLEDNHVEAIRQYRAYEQLLRDELSLAPSATLRAMLLPALSPTTARRGSRSMFSR
jgi:DNA-binding SARP family transcriptional activator